ncbi:hypothetical protein B0H13DRAFT_1931964 [Mycena leptocephala]|nr:hypothetical protein B0H13DRAFT_1931964 [Mycena leptocephala]
MSLCTIFPIPAPNSFFPIPHRNGWGQIIPTSEFHEDTEPHWNPAPVHLRYLNRLTSLQSSSLKTDFWGKYPHWPLHPARAAQTTQFQRDMAFLLGQLACTQAIYITMVRITEGETYLRDREEAAAAVHAEAMGPLLTDNYLSAWFNITPWRLHTWGTKAVQLSPTALSMGQLVGAWGNEAQSFGVVGDTSVLQVTGWGSGSGIQAISGNGAWNVPTFGIEPNTGSWDNSGWGWGGASDWPDSDSSGGWGTGTGVAHGWHGHGWHAPRRRRTRADRKGRGLRRMGAFFRSPRRIGPLSHLEQFQIVSRLVARYLPRIRAEILALYS